VSVKLLEKLPMFRLAPAPAAPVGEHQAKKDGETEVESIEPPPLTTPGIGILIAFLAAFIWIGYHTFAATSNAGNAFTRTIGAVSILAIPFLLSFFPLYAALRKVKVYEEFVEGAKEGFQVAVRIIPYLVAILVAVGMFRAAGGIEIISRALGPALDWLGLPADLLPIVLVRPLSGSATTGLFAELVKHWGPDSLISRTAGTILGSTETTFYVIAVYFGSVAVKRTRHAILAGLTADLTGVIASVIVCRLMFA